MKAAEESEEVTQARADMQLAAQEMAWARREAAEWNAKEDAAFAKHQRAVEIIRNAAIARHKDGAA